MNIPREFTESDEVLSQWGDFGPPLSTWELVAIVVGFAGFLWLNYRFPGPWF
jgi:hypothetical protein